VDRWVFCALHAQLRIVNKMIDVFCHVLYDKDNHAKLDELVAAIKANGVPYFSWKLTTTKSGNRQIDVTTLNGPDCLKVLEVLSKAALVKGLLPVPAKVMKAELTKAMLDGAPKAECIARAEKAREEAQDTIAHWQAAWANFNALNKIMQEPAPSPAEQQAFEEYVGLWADNFGPVMWDGDGSVYIHIVHSHAIPLMRRLGSIGKYSQQGFERAHKVHRLIYSRATSHDGGESEVSSIEQIFYVLLRRLEYYWGLPNLKPDATKQFIAEAMALPGFRCPSAKDMESSSSAHPVINYIFVEEDGKSTATVPSKKRKAN